MDRADRDGRQKVHDTAYSLPISKVVTHNRRLVALSEYVVGNTGGGCETAICS